MFMIALLSCQLCTLVNPILVHMTASTHTGVAALAHLKLLHEVGELPAHRQLTKDLKQLGTCKQHLPLCIHLH